ncbi:MAG: hypothetical protein H6713_42585 [Myxococcales bacterium]|nr:hypothetical protein [Myxococcales bacterium]
MTIIGEFPFQAIELDPGARVLTLRWRPSTATMSADEFREELLRFADATVEHRVQGALIDVRAFAHKPDSALAPWRAIHIIPRYNRAGIRRFAFLKSGDGLPPSKPASRPPQPAYEERWFNDEALARNWLSTGAALQITVEYELRDDVELEALRAGVGEFVREIGERHPGVDYCSLEALGGARSFVHVITCATPEELARLQAAPFFKAFAGFLAPRCAAAPKVTRRRVVASTSAHR